MFESKDTEALLLVDVSNAFNSLNCQVALRNHCVRHLVLVNKYHSNGNLFIHGIFNRWTYFFRTFYNIQDLLLPLEEFIQSRLIPQLCGKYALNHIDRNLLSLPSSLVGMGIINPCHSSVLQYRVSTHVTAPLIDLVFNQSESNKTCLFYTTIMQKCK